MHNYPQHDGYAYNLQIAQHFRCHGFKEQLDNELQIVVDRVEQRRYSKDHIRLGSLPVDMNQSQSRSHYPDPYHLKAVPGHQRLVSATVLFPLSSRK
jgi:hypothetical protein